MRRLPLRLRPALDGRPRLRALPLRARKRLLRRSALGSSGPLRSTPHRNGDGEALFAEACRKGWEGLIAKRADAPYAPRRSARLAEAQVRARAGARDRRLHRAARLRTELGALLRRLLRGRRAALRRQGRHRLRRSETLLDLARAARAAAPRHLAVRRRGDPRAARAPGCEPSSSPRSASPSGPRRAPAPPAVPRPARRQGGRGGGPRG